METTEGIVSVFDRQGHKMGWKACTTSTLRIVRRALFWSFDQFCFLCFSLEDFLNVD